MLCILLSSGYSLLYAQSPAVASFSPIQLLQDSFTGENVGSSQHDQLPFFKAVTPDAEKGLSFLYSTESEIEEDELAFFKKVLESSSYFTALLYVHIIAFLLGSLACVLRFCQQFSFFSTHRLYLLFGVFRV
ncbi:hypothetical protein TH61_00200 [Rufibacter sp. DG15C]|nr:hypothetical protein TH61_00200 [Rufibacter sp. DG15C]